MASRAVQVADAITAAINAAEWALPFRAERSYADWDDELTELNRLRVDVVPKFDPSLDLDTRATNGWELAVDIGVRKRFDIDQQNQVEGRIKLAEIDKLVELVETLAEMFIPDRFTALDSIGAVWMNTTIPALYVRDHLRINSQFTGFVRHTFILHTVTR